MASLGLYLGVGILAAVILTMAIPTGMAALLLAPLVALPLLFAFGGLWAARRRRRARAGAHPKAQSHTR